MIVSYSFLRHMFLPNVTPLVLQSHFQSINFISVFLGIKPVTFVLLTQCFNELQENLCKEVQYECVNSVYLVLSVLTMTGNQFQEHP